MAKKSAKVEEIRTLMRGLPEDMIENIGIGPLKELYGQFETLKDLRYQPFVEHRLSDIVMITLIAGKSGGGRMGGNRDVREGERDMAADISTATERDTIARHDTAGDEPDRRHGIIRSEHSIFDNTDGNTCGYGVEDAVKGGSGRG
jgi:hypothetical protein